MILIMSGMTAICFNKRSTLDLGLAFFVPFIYLPKIALEDNLEYVGPIDRKIYPKTTLQDWRDAILFAIVAASSRRVLGLFCDML